ncbi:MAG: hypothetical protein WC088_06280 [Candidatus Izemoplasmatales bacterium]|jgi:hypothetical protein
MEKKPMIVRITKTEFELDDGRIFHHPIELDDVPTIEEFQKIYDRSRKIVQEMIDNAE